MTPKPQPRPLSPQAKIMLEIFQLLNSEFSEVKVMVSSDEFWSEETLEVLAALDAFADEQRESA